MEFPAPYISTGGIYKDPNDTAWMMNRFNLAKDADSENRLRGLRNTAAYMNDILPGYLKHALAKEGRSEQNFNIIMPIIRGHVGNVLMNWFDPKFTGRDGDPIDAVEALYKIYLQQKELYNYKQSATSCYENGYVYRGVEQLILDRPSSNPREWGLKFVSMPSGRVIFDQNADTENISRSSKEAWICHFITPKALIIEYGMPNNSVERAILMKLLKDEKDNPSFDAPKVQIYDKVDNRRLNSNIFVVEHLHIEYEKKYVQYLKNGILIPSSGYEVGTMEDYIFKKHWADQNYFELSEDMILTMPDKVPCLYSTVFAPDIGVLLEDKKDFRQLGGHLPLYAWSFLQKDGVSLGLVDYLWDIQQDFNKREMAKTKIITQTPVNGKVVIRKDAFSDDNAAFERVVADANDSSKPIVLPEGSLPIDACFKIIAGPQTPPSILQDESFKLALSQNVGMLPPALQGRSERSADSGLSIGRKVVEANVMMKQESNSVIQHENDKHEDWLILAVKLFGNPINTNRTFTSADGKTSVTINEIIGIDDAGETVMRNQISALKRPNVTISQAKENDFVRQAHLETAVASLQAMPPSETNVLNRAAIEYTVVTNMDYGTDADKERAKRLADKQLKVVELGADLQIKNLKLQLNGSQPPIAGGTAGVPATQMQGAMV